jgi:tetratricopeptide (TPR) repeat protein
MTLQEADGANGQMSEPMTFEDFRDLGDARFSQSDFEGAIAFYDEAIALHPHDYEAWFNRGASLSKLGRDAEAIQSYGTAISLLSKLGRDAEAIESKAIKSNGTAISLLGRIHRHRMGVSQMATADPLWEKLNRIVVMAIGGACLGAAIAQLPGAIIVGLIALTYGWYISFSKKALRRSL